MNFDFTIAAGVLLATAATDAIFVMFSSAVTARRPIAAANWSSMWYLLSSFAVINITGNWRYVFVAAAGSWIGAYVSLVLLHAPTPPTPSPLAKIAEIGRKRRFLQPLFGVNTPA